MVGSNVTVRMAELPFTKPRVRVPSRPLPAGTLHWSPSRRDPNPFLPRLLWTVEGFQGVQHYDPAPTWFIPPPKDDPSTPTH